MTRPTMAAVRELSGWKEPCYLATTANIDLATGGLLTIDGGVPTAGRRILVKDQTDASENGIYLASEGEWYRAPDAASSRNINHGVLVWVQGGVVNTSTVWFFSVLDPDIGDSSITLTQMNFGGSVISYATVAEVRAATAGNKIVKAEHIETASALVALTDGANIGFDWDAGLNRTLTIGGDRTLDNPSNGQPGTWRTIVITQDGTGGRTLTFGNQYKFVGRTPTSLSAAASSVDVLSIFCVTASSFLVFSALDLGA
jgi:phage-related tail fiber protein